MTRRDSSLDTIRIAACMLVVLMHSPMPSADANGPFLAMLSYFTAPCIGLFFMVSGALLLPVTTDYFTFLRRRLSKVVVPTLIWTAIYLAAKIYYSASEIDILRSLASIPFSAQGHGVLWFMYTLIGLYLLAPVLSAWLTVATGRELRFILLLWAVMLCYPLLAFGADINTSTTGILYYFTGYAGYFLLGHALARGRIKIPTALTLTVSLSGVALLLVLKRFSIDFDFYSLFWYESIFIAALCCLYWSVLKKISEHLPARPFMRTLSGMSFGVYLMHILIMRFWLWRIRWIQNIPSYILQTAVIAVLTTCAAVAACMLLSRTPLANLLTGYRRPKPSA